MKTHQSNGQAGFTLIELLIGIVIIALLVALALPDLRTMLLNTKTRNAAESIQTGLQKARAEAVARNTNIAFTMGANSAWTINVVNPASVIESRSANDGSSNVAVVIAGGTTITFNSLGTVGIPNFQPNNADGTPPLSQVDLTIPYGDKPYRIVIGAGGSSKMCQPGGYGLSAC